MFDSYAFQRLRPTIPKNTLPKLAELLERCWQQDPTLRPDFTEIIAILQQIAKEVAYVFLYTAHTKTKKRKWKKGYMFLNFYHAFTSDSIPFGGPT